MRSRLRVLVLAQYFPPDMGGGSTRASNVVKGLLYKGCEVEIVAAFPHYPHGNVPKKYKGKPIVPERFCGAKALRVWIPSLPHSSIVSRIILHACFAVSALFALPSVGRVDVIWAANPNLFSIFPAIIYGFVKRRPIVRNVDDLWPEVFYELGIVRSKLMRRILDFLAWLSYAVPAAIAPISAGYKRRIVEKYRVYADKIHVVEVGVERVKPISSSGHDKKDRFVVMYSGVLGLGYDFDVVLDAASLLEKNEDVVLIIRGVGELAPELKRRINELNLNNIILDNRFLPKDELSALLASADVFLLPMASASCIDDGLPTKVFEYQAYGKPIICVSGGEPARYVEKTRSGIVVKPNDAYGLAHAITKLYKDRHLASELGWNGWRYVSENLILERIGERIYEVFVRARADQST
jgi:colanic acid biosynthesis glycosyl transferase WcaI